MSTSPLQSSQRRMRNIARSVRALSVGGMVTVVVVTVMFWSSPAWISQTALSDWKLSAYPLNLGLAPRLTAALFNLPALLLTLAAFWQLWRLFGCYERGEVFSAAATHHLRRLGQTVVAMAPVMPLTHTLTILALTWQNPKGQRLFTFELSPSHYVELLFGLILLAMALVMQDARRLAEENAEFV